MLLETRVVLSEFDDSEGSQGVHSSTRFLSDAIISSPSIRFKENAFASLVTSVEASAKFRRL